MSNFTVSIPDDLLTDAKVVAAKTGTSVNAIIRLLLDGFVQKQRLTMSGNFEILLRYSLGSISAKTAVKQLHLEDEESLYRLLSCEKLPVSRLSSEVTDGMQKRFTTMCDTK